MYSSFHSSVGIIICLIVPGRIGFFLAFFSHHFIDKLIQERRKNLTNFLCFELLLLCVLFTGIIAMRCYWLLLGVFFANLMDIIDKPRYYLFNRKQIFKCHQLEVKKKGLPIKYTQLWNDSIVYLTIILIIIFKKHIY